LQLATRRLLDEGLPAVFRRHADVATLCRTRLHALTVELFPKSAAFSSPTVTAAKIPPGWTWPGLDRALRERGMVVGGSYGPLAGKVFRIGHMGSQADRELVGRGMNVLEEVLEGKK
jgi:aspartate aminotransferase-like enzyme